MATRFLMIEYPGSWPAQPLDVFADDTRALLSQATTAVGGQVLLVRRPDQQLQRPDEIRGVSHRWWLVDTSARTQLDGTWTVEADLAAAAFALSDTAPDLPGATTTPAQLALLVCCHAKRDQCCAIEGRPLATDLASRWPEATWQCTHLGGHRFAPTFLVLPDGVCYGRVPSGAGPEVVAALLNGEVADGLLRGFCAQQPWEQAGVADVLEGLRSQALGDASSTDTGVIALVAARVDHVTSEPAGEDRWSVFVTVDEIAHTREVRAEPNAPVPLSCGDAPPKRSVTYRVVR